MNRIASAWIIVATAAALGSCATTALPTDQTAETSVVMASIPQPSITESGNFTAAASGLSALSAASDTALDVWMFDIGQGACVIVDCPDGDRPLVVDCGSRGASVNNPRAEVVNRASRLVASLGRPTVVISHGDEDHHSLLPLVVNPADVADVWLGGKKADYLRPADAWLNAAGRAGVPVTELPPLFFGPEFSDLHCGRAKVDILAANATSGESKNGDSIVLGLSIGDVTVILPGDAEGDTERLALANRDTLPRLKNTHGVIVGSHHGSDRKGSNGEDGSGWEAAWNPVAAIFSMTPKSYRHPQCAVVQRYAAHMPPLGRKYRFTCGTNVVSSRQVSTRMLSTHENGDILVRVRPTRLSIYCQFTGPPCSGSIPAVPAE